MECLPVITRFSKVVKIPRYLGRVRFLLKVCSIKVYITCVDIWVIGFSVSVPDWSDVGRKISLGGDS